MLEHGWDQARRGGGLRNGWMNAIEAKHRGPGDYAL